MIKGVGIDICQIGRLHLKLANKILTDEEMMLMNRFKLEQRQISFLAGRFAAKEAIYKAINQVLPSLKLKDIVVLNDESHKPYVLKPVLEDMVIWVSISHEKDYAIAQAILETI